MSNEALLPVTEALLPCPFCGGPAEIQLDDGRNRVGVGCTKCTANQSPSWNITSQFWAIRAWNTRALTPSAREQGLDWTGGRAWPEQIENIAEYWAQWEEDRAGRGTYSSEELAETAGEFANGLADHLAALSTKERTDG